MRSSTTMKTKVYAILDTKAEAFGQPFFMLTDGLATRAFTNAAMNPEGEFIKYPLDYILYQIGEYDDATAKLTSVHPVEILSAHAAIAVQRKQFESERAPFKENQDTHSEINTHKQDAQETDEQQGAIN